jgi:putative N-acetylmannosamine-6-phosphate epimerase/predicted NBD/HSP70 family sugar kinase
MDDLLKRLRRCPLVASVQADEGTPLDDPGALLRLAQASIGEGVQVLRLQGVENIRTIRERTGLPVAGLVKRRYEGSEVYITPTVEEVDALIGSGCEVIALDGTARLRPGGVRLEELVARVRAAGRIPMADCDSLESIVHAVDAGASIVGTTLSGYTEGSPAQPGPDLDLVRRAVQAVPVPVLAEGRYTQPWQVRAALQAGATGVVVGGALNDPIKQTRLLAAAAMMPGEPVGAVDIGGTWIRYGRFSAGWRLEESHREELPRGRQERLDWIRRHVERSGVHRVGVSTGGVVDPRTGEVWDAKAIIPEHVGSVFSRETLGVEVIALNDGLATAWGHACLPRFAGKRVATLALGTGVGCGLVMEGAILMGSRGEYPRLNDLPSADGETYERLLGGAALTAEPSREMQARATKAFLQAALTLQEMYFPDEIVVCGGVGLSPWLAPWMQSPGLSASPLGPDAGLYGAAALALFPPLHLR